MRCTPAHSPAGARVVTRRRAALPPVRACGQCEQADRRGSAAASPPLVRQAAAADEASCSSSARSGADGSGQSLDATATEVAARSDASASSPERDHAESLGVRAALAALMFYKGAQSPPSRARLVRSSRALLPVLSPKGALVQAAFWHKAAHMLAVHVRSAVPTLRLNAAVSGAAVISPLLPKSCRFLPTCSEYSMRAYREFGVARGTALTAWRLLRCNPLSEGGWDPPRWPPPGLAWLFGAGAS